MEKWAEQWQHYVNRYFLGAYLQSMGMETRFTAQHEVLLLTLLLEKAIYELGYELNGRPAWTVVPLRGIYYLMQRYLAGKQDQQK